ncbi:MAG: hypothetical protein AAF551_15275, partial [Bacteroidota bacterium]
MQRIWLSVLLGIGLRVYAMAQLEKVEAYYDVLEKENKQERQTIEFIQQDAGMVADYSRLSQIILLRHGEPALNKKGWRKRKVAMKFIQDYDSAVIYPPEHLPVSLQKEELRMIYTSNLNRSISTASYVFDLPDIQKSDPLFREFERKIFSFPNMKLPLKWWLTGSRMLWLMGLNKKGIERFGQAKERAREGAKKLESESISSGK